MLVPFVNWIGYSTEYVLYASCRCLTLFEEDGAQRCEVVEESWQAWGGED